MGVLGLINDDFNYKKMSTRTVSLIEHQSKGDSVIKSIKAIDLFQEDVRLIAKEGKLVGKTYNALFWYAVKCGGRTLAVYS